MKRFLIILILLTVGCQQEMARQPAFRPLQPSAFFEDGRSARPPVPGTIARGHLQEDAHLHTGRYAGMNRPVQAVSFVGAGSPGGGFFGPLLLTAAPAILGGSPLVHEFPTPITRALLERGRERYNIFCSVCHGLTGEGNGMIVQRGFSKPPSYHIPRLREAPVGHIFEVITKGYGAMPDLAAQIPVADRWAIVAYVRALQFSQNRPLQEIPAADRLNLEKKGGQR